MEEKILNIGIGFATGRKIFQKTLRSYIENWQESGLVENGKVNLKVFVAYDLSYNNTKKKDYINISDYLMEKIDEAIYIGKNEIKDEIKLLVKENVIKRKQAKHIFGKGYASQRNAILHFAIKNDVDYLIFIDDDEYPLAVSENANGLAWQGQQILSAHIKNLKNADVTHGHHCGYISPIPFIKYNDKMNENDFRNFIEAISNDIISWENISFTMKNSGISYAKDDILYSSVSEEVEEINNAKFISGSNLGINLTKPTKVFPFYNPIKARGEDTFLSTCLSDKKVLKIPEHTFHDSFSLYTHILDGVLPMKLKKIKTTSKKNIGRFYKACIGWIRYKPLLLYIINKDTYKEEIQKMKNKLIEVLPKICDYFNDERFNNVMLELEKYDNNVVEHYDSFIETKNIWFIIMNYFENHKSQNE